MKAQFHRRYADMFEFVPIGFFTFAQDGQIIEVNTAGARLLGTKRSDLLNQKFAKFIADGFQDGFQHHCKKVLESGIRETYDLKLFKKDRSLFWAQLESIAEPADDTDLNSRQFITAITDITDRKHAEDALCNALDKSHQQAKEVSALLESSRAVLQYREFKDSAKSIFNSCKNLIGAKAGYVALLTRDGSENDLLHLDAGGLTCTVDPTLPMPIRGLREKAYRLGETVFDNNFAHSEWMEFLPGGHVKLDNVLFAPLVINGNAVGLLGLANKPGGFTNHDARSASSTIAGLPQTLLDCLECLCILSNKTIESIVLAAAANVRLIDELVNDLGGVGRQHPAKRQFKRLRIEQQLANTPVVAILVT